MRSSLANSTARRGSNPRWCFSAAGSADRIGSGLDFVRLPHSAGSGSRACVRPGPCCPATGTPSSGSSGSRRSCTCGSRRPSDRRWRPSPARPCGPRSRSASVTGTCAGSATCTPSRQTCAVPTVFRRSAACPSPESSRSPLAVAAVTVTFAALSYAGTLAVSLTADPDVMIDLDETAAALQAQQDALTARMPAPR